MVDEIIGTNGRKQYINLKDPKHLPILTSAGMAFVTLCAVAAIFWRVGRLEANLSNEWKNHCDADVKFQRMAWTIPYMISWVNADNDKLNIKHFDPIESVRKVREIQAQ